MGRKPATSLAPGFRFHPTDEELVRYYLRRKICGKGFRFDAIAATDVYKSEPWELPGKSKLKSRDLEWYFFSMLDRKYGNGSKTNRATENGYWKTTGKDRPVLHKAKTVGMKKTLVYHRGRAPHGARSNWVMHEYRLIDEDLEKAGVLQDAFVLCRIFQKSGSGPKNGEQYGAPFEEEEWDDDEVATVPGEQLTNEVVVFDNPYPEVGDVNTDADELVQNNYDISPSAPPPFDYCDDSGSYLFDDQKPFIGTRENYESNLVDGESCFDVLNFPEPCEGEVKQVKVEHLVDSGENPLDASYLLDEHYLNANQEPVLNEGLFLETDDLINQMEPGPSDFDMLDEYLKYFDSADSNSTYVLPENGALPQTESQVVATKSLLTPEVDKEIEYLALKSQQLPDAQGSDVASSSSQCPEDTKFNSDYKHQFVNMLGKKPSPYSFSTKDASLRLASSSHSSSSIHVTAGMVQIRNTDAFGNRLSWTFNKNGNIEVVLSLALPQTDGNSTSVDMLANMLSGKASSAMARVWFYLIVFWVFIISISFKIASLVSTKQG
uniref:NAC domain-containing protein n=1 Tax=Kalanchoe fedtschenkoi TaxID=63787 RepID=A0A7N0UET1_KALFE